MNKISSKKHHLPKYRVGEWLASDQQFLNKWLKKRISEVKKEPQKLLPVVEAFKEFIEEDPEVFMLFSQMFDQVPKVLKRIFPKRYKGVPLIKDYHQMLQLINRVMTRAPEFNQTGLVGFPINAILDFAMGTEAGNAAFLNPEVNWYLKNILTEWGIYLKSGDSKYVLNKNPKTGWLGKSAMKAMPGFVEDFQCDPKAPHYGFTSWDNFFTREFRTGRRPVASPGNDNIIANACESAPYKIAHKVKELDTFWIKSQPYALRFMMDNDPLLDYFVGGTVYQAFLSALKYHRWHSPVSGTIVKAYVIDGTYYSETRSEFYDPAGPNESQGYITEVATRALIFIEADNPAIGLMCFMAVGMAEVSSNEITVYEGQHVTKGEQIGMFHFGGSTHCLFFGPHVKLKFDLHHNGQKPGLNSKAVHVKAKIATVLNRKKRSAKK